VRVQTDAGWLCLASDAAHYYENVLLQKPFPIVVDIENMLQGFARLKKLASTDGLIIPGHDPLVRDCFPVDGPEYAFRLDLGPKKAIPF
jgi:glyoxylase-like metal-dependent hydrolase (beta-lactamase superfamily II)